MLHKFLFTLGLFVAGTMAFAQNISGYNNLELLVGQSLTNKSPQLTLSYYRETTAALTLGASAQAIRFSENFLYTASDATKKERLLLAGGLFLNMRILSGRNYSGSARIAAYLGSDRNDYAYWPELSINNAFFLSKRLKLNAGAFVQYYFQSSFTTKFNPGFFLGMSFLF